MNTFALEIWDDESLECTFYTVRWDDIDISETDKFIIKYDSDEMPLLKKALQQLLSFLFDVIGEQGAKKAFFRFENKAEALPPSGTFELEELTLNLHYFPLRLYCLRLTEHLVILFNGGEKTDQSAQGSKASMAFHDANAFAAKILEALKDGDIHITEDQRFLRYFNNSNDIVL